MFFFFKIVFAWKSLGRKFVKQCKTGAVKTRKVKDVAENENNIILYDKYFRNYMKWWLLLKHYHRPKSSRHNLSNLKKKIMTPFYGQWGSIVSRLQSHYDQMAYLLPLSPQKFLVLLWSTSEGWKAESTLNSSSSLNMKPLDWEFSIKI